MELQRFKMIQYLVCSCVLILYLPKTGDSQGRGQLKYPVFNVADGPHLYQNFIKAFHKTFRSSDEYRRRYQNFVHTLQKVNDINRQPGSMKMVPNFYADLDEQDREEAMLMSTPKIDSELKKLNNYEGVPKAADLFRFDMKKK